MIIPLAEKLYEELLAAIDNAEESLNQAPQLIDAVHTKLANQYVATLKAEVLKHPHFTPEEEIYLFKAIKPKFVSLQLYYYQVQNILLNQPTGSFADTRIYYEKELAGIKIFFDHHHHLYAYYRAKDTYLDTHLFSRGSVDWPQSLGIIPIGNDERFSTPADYIFSKIMANEKLRLFLQAKLADPDQLATTSPDTVAKPIASPMKWTGETINLVEIAYGFYYTRQLNHGKAGIGEIVRFLEEVLHVKIGRAHRRLIDIKQRKRLSQSKFLDEMRAELAKRINDDNE